MTNKFYRKDAIINVYVADIAEYNNNGNLVGGWVSLPIEENDWKDFLKTIGNPEEIAIHDYENNSGIDSLVIKANASIEDLNEVAEALEVIENKGMVNAFNALYGELGDFGDALEHLEYFN